MLKYIIPFILVFTIHSVSFAGDVFMWVSTSGSVSFTDDEKRIPPMYKNQAKKVEFGPLKDYKRATLIVPSTKDKSTVDSCGNDKR